MHVNRCSAKEAMEFLGIERDDYFDAALNQRIADKSQPEAISSPSEEVKVPKLPSDLSRIYRPPESVLYTKLRGYTPEFMQKFDISFCDKGWYKDYLIIPLKDEGLGLESFEARKAFELDYLFEFYNATRRIQDVATYKRFKKKFEDDCAKFKMYYSYDDHCAHIDGHPVDNPVLTYLVRPKVLYPKNSFQKDTLFNVSNLDFTKDVYISEGTGTLPKLWLFDKNCTSMFGTAYSDKQVELLKKFQGKKIIIPNYDRAGFSMIWGLSREIDDVWVLPIRIDDTDDNFSKALVDTQPIEASRFILRNSGYFQNLPR
jgi:hypothetical protein